MWLPHTSMYKTGASLHKILMADCHMVAKMPSCTQLSRGLGEGELRTDIILYYSSRLHLVHDYHVLLRKRNSGQTGMLQSHDWVLSATVQRRRLSIRHKLIDDRLRFRHEEEHVLVIARPVIHGRKPLHPRRELVACDPREEKRDSSVAQSALKLGLHVMVYEGRAETRGGGRLERPPDVVQVQLRDAHQDEVGLSRINKAR